MSRPPSWWAAKKGKRDEPHAAVRDGLRALGYHVADTAGSPEVLDLFTYDRLSNPWWLEVKTPGKGKLTPAQERFIAQLDRRGHPWAIVESLDDALDALGHDLQARATRNAAATHQRIAANVARYREVG